MLYCLKAANKVFIDVDRQVVSWTIISVEHVKDIYIASGLGDEEPVQKQSFPCESDCASVRCCTTRCQFSSTGVPYSAMKSKRQPQTWLMYNERIKINLIRDIQGYQRKIAIVYSPYLALQRQHLQPPKVIVSILQNSYCIIYILLVTLHITFSDLFMMIT